MTMPQSKNGCLLRIATVHNEEKNSDGSKCQAARVWFSQFHLEIRLFLMQNVWREKLRWFKMSSCQGVVLSISLGNPFVSDAKTFVFTAKVPWIGKFCFGKRPRRHGCRRKDTFLDGTMSDLMPTSQGANGKGESELFFLLCEWNRMFAEQMKMLSIWKESQSAPGLHVNRITIWGVKLTLHQMNISSCFGHLKRETNSPAPGVQPPPPSGQSWNFRKEKRSVHSCHPLHCDWRDWRVAHSFEARHACLTCLPSKINSTWRQELGLQG